VKRFHISGRAVVLGLEDVGAAAPLGLPVIVAAGSSLLDFSAAPRIACRECGASGHPIAGRIDLHHEAGCEIGPLLRRLDEVFTHGARASRRERRRLLDKYRALEAAYVGATEGRA
jgi:hypothetical protein